MREPIIVEYKHAESMFDGSIYYGGMVITAMMDMCQAYRERNTSCSSCWHINGLLEKLLPHWVEEKTRLQQYLIISEIIDSLSIPENEEIIYRSLKANKGDILASIRMLLEIGVPVEALPDKDAEQKCFKIVYKEFCRAKGNGLQQFASAVKEWQSKDKLFQKLYEVTGSKPRAIYLHGFYYVNALQSRLITALQTLEVPIYFLNHIDDAEPEFYEVWKHNPLFSSSWRHRIIQEERRDTKNDTPIVRQFVDDFAMVNYVARNNEKVRFYGPICKDLQELMDTFFPPKENKTQLLSYPAGRYLLDLYAMWNDEIESIELLPDKVKSCLATGWAGKTFEDGKRLLAIYEQVQDYFADCRTVEQWLDRSKLLLTVKKQVVGLFAPREGSTELQRWHNFMCNPLGFAGPFACSEADIVYLDQIINNIAKDANSIFNSKNALNLKQHFTKISRLMAQKADKATLSSEERIVVDKIKQRLSFNPDDMRVSRVGHLVEAMKFFLGGSLTEADDGSDYTGDNIVLGLSSIEAHPFLHPKKKAVICCCDENNMPGSARTYPWPLTGELLKKVKLNRDTQLHCQNHLWYMESTGLVNRYLFHLAKQLSNVEFSWIELKNNKILNPSVYIRQLDADGIITEQGMLLQHKQVKRPASDFALDIDDLLEEALSQLPEEVSLSLDACKQKWRVLYDYYLKEHPSFTSNFQLNFYLQMLIPALSMGDSEQDIRECAREVFAIYPARNATEQEEIISFALRRRALKREEKFSSFDGVEYTDNRLYVEYLDKNGVDEIRKPTSITKSIRCMYCPHLGKCFVEKKEF